MILRQLRVADLRNLEGLQFEPRRGVNVLVGANGAGKTSILEAIYLLSHGRSFRTRRNEILRRSGAASASVFGVVEGARGPSRLGLSLEADRWRGRVDGCDVGSLAELLICCAVTCFEPGSHALISGAGDIRRRFVDWGVFHVEPTFPHVARRYRRALRQRNAALRSGVDESTLRVWDMELAESAEQLAVLRNAYWIGLAPVVEKLAQQYLPELGACELRLRQGWPSQDSLLTALHDCRDVDRQRGHTSRGPHRADWTMTFANAPRREQLSRGQEKLCAIACMIGQARRLFEQSGQWPIVILDDLMSELDPAHQALAFDSLSGTDQVFITGTEASVAHWREAALFHVEQGKISGLL